MPEEHISRPPLDADTEPQPSVILERKKNALYDEYYKLYEKMAFAEKQFEKAKQEWFEAVLYEKAKRRVMRDLIANAGNVSNARPGPNKRK